MRLKRGFSSDFNANFPQNRKGQVTIFVIIAIFIIAAVVAFLIYRSSIPTISQIPVQFQPAYNLFLSCIDSDMKTGLNILESQGGYITPPAFEPGSSYMPFSSQLNFLGTQIPYWYYVSGNNFEKSQVPSVSDMEKQLAQFVDERIRNCDFSSLTSSGLQVNFGQPSSTVSISADKISISMNMDMNLAYENSTTFAGNHKYTIDSQLGNLYTSAKKVYDYEQRSLFLENYTIDAIRNYAPVDGFEISCAPLTWNAYDVVSNLSQALENNIDSLRTGNNLSDYFNVKIDVQNLRFMTSPDWPHTFEINPTEDSLLIAEPIGNQAGLGVLGFCYTPYHFVYDAKYPVLATISSGGETFQFPMAVIVQGNLPRLASNASAVSGTTPVLCPNRNTDVTVNVADANSNKVDANISYSCIGESCDIGQTTSGTLTAKFPQCVNGYIIAKANGFADGSYLFTTTQSGSVSIILDRLYDRDIELSLDGNPYNGNAVINFLSSDGTSKTVVYPQQKNVQLSAGDYTVQVYIYQNSSIQTSATTVQKCLDVTSGIPGILGIPQQQCFDINIPQQIISNALSAGGQSEVFILDSNLQNSNSIKIGASSFPKPNTIDQLQQNYLLFENKTLSISFA